MRFRMKFCGVHRQNYVTGKMKRGAKVLIKMVYKMSSQKCTFEWLFFNHSKPEDFVKCQWQKKDQVHLAWLFYRVALAIYFFATLIFQMVYFNSDKPDDPFMKYFIFFTHWTYILETVQFIVAFIVVLVTFIKAKKNKGETEGMSKMPWYFKMYWIMYSMVLPNAFVVSLIFWAVIYNPENFPSGVRNAIEHGFNSFFMLIDFCLAANPLKYSHFYIPGLYALVYAFFTYVYYVSGGTGVKGMIPIYRIVNWKTPTHAIFTCFLCAVVLLTLFCCFVYLQHLKTWILTRKNKRSQPPAEVA